MFGYPGIAHADRPLGRGQCPVAWSGESGLAQSRLLVDRRLVEIPGFFHSGDVSKWRVARRCGWLFADALEQRVHDDEARGLVQRIRSSTTALREMFDALIDVSRLEQGAVEPMLGDVEIDPLLERLADEAEPAARAKGLELRRAATGLRVRSDPVLLGRILQNLLVNAVRYTREGHVALSAVQNEGDIHILVSDTGPGIPEERRDAIAASAGARGDRVENDVVGSPAAGPGALGGSRVLVIDDDLDILVGMRALLEEWGAQVALAGSAGEALESVEMGGPPDAVVADYRLGDALGTEVIETIRRAAGRRAPAIVVTGSSSESLLADLARHGLTHLSKPIAPARLRAALLELLRGAA